MTSVLELFELSVQLREIHATVKPLYGDKFEGWVQELEPVMRERATASNGNIFAAAIQMVKDPRTDEKLAMLILAVAVELKLRQNAEAER